MRMASATLFGLAILGFIYLGVTACTYNETVNNYYYPVTLPEKQMSDKEIELFNLINTHRIEIGLSALIPEKLATEVAIGNNNRMIAIDTANHDGIHSRAVEAMAKRYGEVAERNILTPQGMISGYLNSPNHKATLERKDVTHLSISIKGLYNTCIVTNY